MDGGGDELVITMYLLYEFQSIASFHEVAGLGVSSAIYDQHDTMTQYLWWRMDLLQASLRRFVTESGGVMLHCGT